MDEDIKRGITDSVERILRYIIPGAAFFLILSLSFPCKFKQIPPVISENSLLGFLIILTTGMSIYVVYSHIIRFTLERIVFKCEKSPVNLFCEGTCLNAYSKAHAKLLLCRESEKLYPKGYYTYLWSITHYTMILSILLFIFSLSNEDNSFFDQHSIIICIIAIVIFILSLCSYWYMQKLEKDTTEILIKKDNASEECKTSID